MKNDGNEDNEQAPLIKKSLDTTNTDGLSIVAGGEAEGKKGHEEEKARTICYIKVKKETTVWNLLALFVAPSITVAIGAYVNVQMPYLLQDPEYFNIPFEEVGTNVGQVLFAGSLVATLITPFMGYAYDIIGRYWVLIPTIFLACLSLAVMPYSAPHFWLLCIFRSFMSCFMRVVILKPLILDYIKSESRGLGVSISAYGFIFGELIMIVLFKVTRNFSMKSQYLVPAIIIATLATSLIFLVREPKIKNSEPIMRPDGQVVSTKQTYWSHFKSLSKEVWQECVNQPKYIFCFVCLLVSRLMNVLFAVYIQLWVMSFEKSGVFSSKEESDGAWTKIIISMQLATILALPVIGYISNIADPRILIPSSFLFRSVVTASFYYIDNPVHWQGFTLCILLVLASLVQFISVEVLFMRNMKSSVRGTLSGIAIFFGSFGTTIFTLAGGIVFDKIGAWAPFMLVAGADGVCLIFAVIFIAFGLLKRDD